MKSLPQAPGPIGVFDSGFGGLTVLDELARSLPDADFIYLGDNARAPYGSRSFELVYRFTLEAVERLFAMGCHLVILACNTASAKALRSIQQRDLPELDPARRVLGVIRPTAEAVGELSSTGRVAIVCTPGTAASGSYEIEIEKLHPSFRTYVHACPMWVPLVENGEHDGPGADYFVSRDVREALEPDSDIDTLVLGCTHYPLLQPKIEQCAPTGVKVVRQGTIVARSLVDYLRRHPEMDARITRGGSRSFYTTDSPEKFDRFASEILGYTVHASRITLP
ncbi:MAG: glutamate racemase [Muribaculaceae bacterium]|nr:glutamate racemase [Muribaculaceae bacterium]